MSKGERGGGAWMRSSGRGGRAEKDGMRGRGAREVIEEQKERERERGEKRECLIWAMLILGGPINVS